jgi:ATP-dependent helicase HepA
MSQQNPMIGQRWISDAETELGLGILIEVETRSLTVLFPRSEETRVYSRANAPLSRIRFYVGDSIEDNEGNNYTVLTVNESNAILRYGVQNADGKEILVSETKLSAHLHLTRPKERLLAAQLDNNEWFDLRVQSLLQREKLAQSPVLGLSGPRLGLIPHQFHIAHEVGTRLAPRVLLADEVGLGKTIEAGLIIHQQLLSGRAGRVLILVPDSLQHQWLVEMRRRFNLAFSLFDLERVASIRASEDEGCNPFQTEQCVLMALDALVDHPDLLEDARTAGWDMLVVDEAHHLGWTPEAASPAYTTVETLARDTAGLLLLTATPEQLGVASYFARLRLLDPARFHSLAAFLDEEENYQPVARAADILLAGEKPDAMGIAVLKTLLDDELLADLDSPEGRQAAINALLDRHGTGRVLFRNTREAIKGFPQRECLPVPLTAPEDWPETGSLARMLWAESFAETDDWCETDARVAWLISLLKQLKREKVLLICRTASVVLALEKHLRLREGLRTTLFHEGMSLIERDRAAAYFAEPDYGAQILLCSEIGSEGRNFQFAHHMVLFDLPLNPDVLEQRIGRLDRIGQTETIKIHVPYFSGTAQERLFLWYHDGLNAIARISPTANAVQESLAEALQVQLLNEDDEGFDVLLANAEEKRTALEAALQQGRDRLLELHSCPQEQAAALIAAVAAEEEGSRLPDYMERVWSAFGVDQEDHLEEHTVIIRPGDHMLTDAFPALDPDGMTVCFEREPALAREDVHFLSWEHPMAQGVLDLFGSSEYGNANIALIRNKGIKPGTVLIECWYRIEAVAPRALGLERLIPQLSLRILLDGNGRNLTANVAHETLRKQLLALEKSTARSVAKQQAALFDTLLAKAELLANQELPAIKTAAMARLEELLGGEITRLKALKLVNPAIRQDEIELLEAQYVACGQHLGQIKAVSDAVRVIVAG